MGALSTCEGTRSVAAGSEKGSVHVVRVDMPSASSRSGELTTLRSMQYEEGAVMALDHGIIHDGTGSVLTAALQRGVLKGIDLRATKEAWSFRSCMSRGVPTS